MSAAGERPSRHNAMQPLAPLIGVWEVEAILGGKVVARSRTQFQWLEGDAFVLQRSEATAMEAPMPPEWVANSPFPIAAIIGADDSSGEFAMLYTDARGVCRICRMTLRDGEWKFWRDAPGFSQRFAGTLAADGRTITARLEKSFDGTTWVHDFDQICRRVG